VLRWPSQAARRDWCRHHRIPRLLVVDGGTPAPLCSDELEDWIRRPVDRAEAIARSATLRHRAMRLYDRRPELGPEGALTFAERSAPLTPTDARIVAALVEAYGSTVAREELMRRGWPAERRPRPNALDVRMTRIRQRIEPLGLTVSAVWRRGYVLQPRATPLGEDSTVWESAG
jgi:DNA-binding response OmpR family regulator